MHTNVQPCWEHCWRKQALHEYSAAVLKATRGEGRATYAKLPLATAARIFSTKKRRRRREKARAAPTPTLTLKATSRFFCLAFNLRFLCSRSNQYLITSDVAHAENMTSTQGLSRTGGKAVTTENKARSRPPTCRGGARGSADGIDGRAGGGDVRAERSSEREVCSGRQR